MCQICDKHHLCWPRKKWDTGYARAVRNHWYFIVEIPKRTLHPAIHSKMTHIPVPRGLAAKSAYEQVIMLERRQAIHQDDPIEKRLELLIALFDCIEQPTADAFRKQLAIITNYQS